MTTYNKPHFYLHKRLIAANRSDFVSRYGHWELEEADVIIVLGGDGMMLTAIRDYMSYDLPIYGINCGSVGFLMNNLLLEELPQRLATAKMTKIHPLIMKLNHGKSIFRAFNEVTLLRQTHQAAKLSIIIDGKVRLEELIADGIIIATPVGSTAYNLSANGPIIPIGNSLLAMTPLSPFRPRHWRGALLPSEARITICNNDVLHRPVSSTADNIDIPNVEQVEIYEDKECFVRILFDEGHSLEERILREQFRVDTTGLSVDY